MPETGESDGALEPVFRNGILRKAQSCKIHIAWIVLPFLLLFAIQIVIAVRVFQQSDYKPHITVVININGTQKCKKSEDESKFPCVKNEIYMTADEPIGPLRCRDDAFVQWSQSTSQSEAAHGKSRIPDNCQDNAFRIATDGKGVVIPQDGMYRVYAKVTFFDKVNHHTSLSVRIDQPQQTECLGNHQCLEARDSIAHSWLTCLAHQPPAAARDTPDFANCAIDGIRRFAAGEVVGLQVAVGFREISGHFKATYMYIHKL